MGSGQTTFMSSAGNRKQRISVFSVAFLLSLKRVSAETGVFRDRNLLVPLLSSELDAIVIDLYVHASLRSQFAMPTGSQPSAAHCRGVRRIRTNQNPFAFERARRARFLICTCMAHCCAQKKPVPAALYICCWDRLINIILRCHPA